MTLGRQAKVLTKAQIEAVLDRLARLRYPTRDRVILLLSVKAGLRAKEIANLKWEMVTDADGEIGSALHLTDDASKGRCGGRIIPLNRELRASLIELRRAFPVGRSSEYVVGTERSTRTSPQVIVNRFRRWYADLGFVGCSSHSGRRTFITNAARRISTVGGSLRDVQMLAGHANLSTTQRYIEGQEEARRRIVDLI